MGYVAYYHVIEGKVDLRAKKEYFVGYNDGEKGFRIYSHLEDWVILNRDVTIDESTMYSLKSTKNTDLEKDRKNLQYSDSVLEVCSFIIANLL